MPSFKTSHELPVAIGLFGMGAILGMLSGCVAPAPSYPPPPGYAPIGSGWSSSTAVPGHAPAASQPYTSQVRGQNQLDPYAQGGSGSYSPSGYPYGPPPVTGVGAAGQPYRPASSGATYSVNQPVSSPGTLAPTGASQVAYPQQTYAPLGPVPPPDNQLGLPPNFADIDAFVEEARTGRFMFGVGVNSNAGVTGQIVLDERNFDITQVPTSFQDFINGTAFRGAGQTFRLEALPGVQVQRYSANFAEPYLFDTPISLSVSGFFFDRAFFDWDEQRYGGRVALGYRLTHDLSISMGMRLEKVDIRDPRVSAGVEPELDRILGDNEVYAPEVTLTHDTRDMPFAPTEGHFIEFSFQHVFGTFDYPRGEVDFRKYHLILERPDGSGRHTFSYGLRVGLSGSQTPLYDNYFAGGFSTLRGFDFRGASPVGAAGVIVGGEFRFLGSVEYQFPLTADDMIKGVVFCDFGTVEESLRFNDDTFRVAPGFGLRVNVPAMGPAPLAFDFAFPVASAITDDEEVFSFFIGFGRL